jgi:predicted nucleic acid-binding protein
MRAERRAVTSLRRSGAKSVSISSVTMAELLYGARLREAEVTAVVPGLRAQRAETLSVPRQRRKPQQ